MSTIEFQNAVIEHTKAYNMGLIGIKTLNDNIQRDLTKLVESLNDYELKNKKN